MGMTSLKNLFHSLIDTPPVFPINQRSLELRWFFV